MAVRVPLVVDVSGQFEELPVLDTISGVDTGTHSGVMVWDGVISPPTLTAFVDDYSPTGFATANTLRLDASLDIEITGFDATGIVDGQVFVVHNISTKKIKLKKNNAGSLASNRLQIKGDLIIEKDESFFMGYDLTTSRWRVISTNK